LKGQVIDMHFPLREATRYQYRNNWADVREGEPEDYNHVHIGRRGRTAGRGHDGIDIYARAGEPVLAPFSGVVIDPTTRWQPWIRERYGRAAVIVSEEPLSSGYVAFLTHLDRAWVEVGQRVNRGEVVGTVGNTGNAEGGPAHLHFELRAPFQLLWPDANGGRMVDAFNPYPSLVAADPKRTD
jgi:murein DD-endopeptidase MepM/ murein hydrolase activator NlpD